MSDAGDKEKAQGSARGSLLNNHKLYRPEAVAAYATRGAGEPWMTVSRFEGALIVALTLLIIAGAVALYAGGR